MAFAIPLAERAKELLAQDYNELSGSAGPVPEVAVAATIEALERGETHYTDRPGILPLREQVTERLAGRFGVAADPKANTVITCGVTEARFVAVQELLEPGQTLYAAVHPERLEGALIVRGAQLTSDVGSAQVLYLASSMPETTQHNVLDAAADEIVVIFELDDEAGIFHPAQLPAFEKRAVTIGDLGGDDLLSQRVGFLAAPAASAAGLRDFKQALTICTTNLSQWAVLAVLEGR